MKDFEVNFVLDSERHADLKLPGYTLRGHKISTEVPRGSSLSHTLCLFYSSDLLDKTTDLDVGSTGVGYVDNVSKASKFGLYASFNIWNSHSPTTDIQIIRLTSLQRGALSAP